MARGWPPAAQPSRPDQPVRRGGRQEEPAFGAAPRRVCCNRPIQYIGVARSDINISYDEAMALCLLLAEAADASTAGEELRDTWAGEARLMIEMILGRTDE